MDGGGEVDIEWRFLGLLCGKDNFEQKGECMFRNHMGMKRAVQVFNVRA